MRVHTFTYNLILFATVWHILHLIVNLLPKKACVFVKTLVRGICALHQDPACLLLLIILRARTVTTSSLAFATAKYNIFCIETVLFSHKSVSHVFKSLLMNQGIHIPVVNINVSTPTLGRTWSYDHIEAGAWSFLKGFHVYQQT